MVCAGNSGGILEEELFVSAGKHYSIDNAYIRSNSTAE